MKKRFSTFLILLACALLVTAKNAKYVFYFIGDGMGVNQVLATEMFKAELNGQIGISPLLFTQFPYSTTATTYSATNRVTDSAAAGTALATGEKTKNGVLGIKKDLSTEVNSIAILAKNSGKNVGITTSVSIDHATPAAFYAHQLSRKSYYQIGLDLIKANFDFYAGSDFLNPQNKKEKNKRSTDLYTLTKNAGYNIANGFDDYKTKSSKSKKMILLQPTFASDKSSIPYAIDRKKQDMSLSQITEAAIDFLSKKNDNGFFIMVEGGKIDWACHSNDAATVFKEVEDMDNAVKIAYEFYKKHPDETLIVVTADHETGGLALGKGPYTLNLKVLANQKKSIVGFTRVLNSLRKETNNNVSWEQVKSALQDNFGFWNSINLTKAQENTIHSVYQKTFVDKKLEMNKSEYEIDEPLATLAKQIINDIALVGWTSGGHSAGLVPVYAIGVGAELFSGRIDNTDIPKKIAKAANYRH